MKNTRFKITAIMVLAIIVTMGVATFLGVLAVRSIGSSDSDQMLLLLGETGRNELEDYFDSVEQSVEIEAAYAEADLANRGLGKLSEHLDWARGGVLPACRQDQGRTDLLLQDRPYGVGNREGILVRES